jgi:hypothetical protein
MNLVKELDFTYSNINYSFSTFTHRILPNNTINYYMNDDRGISIYDQDWNFIRRNDLNSVNAKISLRGDIFIDDKFIYIGNVYFYDYFEYIKSKDFLFLKVDLDLNVINYQHFPQFISIAFDSCNKRIFLLWIIGFGLSAKINIDVYNLNIRKTSEINSTLINSAIVLHDILWLSAGLGFFNNQLYISFKDVNYYQSILVTDINGQYITKHVLIQTSLIYLVNSFTFDHFGNILFTTGGQMCLFSTYLNKTKKCTEITQERLSSNVYPLYAQVDQSGRLVAIDSIKQKVQFYAPFEATSKIIIFY